MDELDLVLYICDREHLHLVALKGGTELHSDTMMGPADGFPALKSVCRDERGRFAPCGGGATPADQPTTAAQKVVHLLENYPEGDRAVKMLQDRHKKNEAILDQAKETRQKSRELLDKYIELQRKGTAEEVRAFAEKYGPTIRASTDEVIALENRARADMAATVQAALTPPHPARVTTDAEQHFPADTTAGKSLREGVNWLNGKVDRSVFGDDPVLRAAHIPKGDEQRDHYRDGLIRLSKNTNAPTVVHEFGHQVESNPHVLAMAQGFWTHRFAGEKQVRMRDVCKGCGYDANEKGAKDQMEKAFPTREAYYIGKTYRRGETELVSMGMEKMMRDPVGFANKDPQYFKFIHAVMHGKRI